MLDHGQRIGAPATTLADLLAARSGQAPAGDGHGLPGQRAEVVERLHDGIEGPGANDLMRLRSQRERRHARVQLWLGEQASHDLRGQRGGGPGVHYILFGREVAAAARTGARRLPSCWIDRQFLLVGQGDLAALPAVPERERHAKVTLPRDAPVPAEILYPLTIASVHMRWLPLDPLARLYQFPLKVRSEER